MIRNKVDSKVFGWFFFKGRFLHKTQPWLQLEAAGVSAPCFHAWPLSWSPGELPGVGVEKKEEGGGVNLYTQSGTQKNLQRLFWRPLRFYCPGTSSYNAPWSWG